MSAQAKLVRTFWKWVAPLVGLAALGLAVFVFFYSPRERNYHLRMTAGNALGMRHQLAQMLQGELAREGIDLELHETAGSEASLDTINTHMLDVALVQGGLEAKGRPNVRQVLTLQMEALHLLVKQELFNEVTRHLGSLEGKTVNLSEVGSGTHALATEVLAFAGLHPRSASAPKGYVPREISRQQLLAEKDRSNLPDAFMLVSLLPSPTARYLVTEHGYRLVPLPFGEAFALEALTPAESRGGAKQPTHIDPGHIYPTVIPAFACSVEPPVPPEPVRTLGTRLLLVAHRDVRPQAVLQLLEATLRSKVAQTGRPPIDAQILDLPPEFPWHDGTRLYKQRNEPIVSGALMDSTHKGAAIFAAAASGLFVLWQWTRQRKTLALAEGFIPYIRDVSRIEKQTRDIEQGQPVEPGQLLALQAELDRLKTEALERFTEGEFRGNELLTGFLAQVTEVRADLTRLIHRRQAQPERQVEVT